ncbi:zinc finger CCCH domain-containing protein 3 isoform X2 [Caretta caretta]|uniref:zinc finger CCCH domain-containing protein 3 isoform X2 n=1 Tax=Caretta caretta TaxID=8467 RepID=UPI003F4B8E52
MEEKEQLRRQIRLLQGLINDHKNIHGNAPVPSPSRTPRWRNPRQTAFNSQGAFSARYSQHAPRDFQSHQGNSWRKKYSLVNRPPAPTHHPGSSASANTLQAFGSQRNSQPPGPQGTGSERQVGLAAGGIVIGVKLPQRTSSALDNRNVSELGSQQGSSMVKVAIAAPKGAEKVHESSSFQSVAQKEDKETSLSVSQSSLRQPAVAGGRDDASPAYPKELGKLRTAKLAKSAPELCDVIRESAIALKSKPQQPLALLDRESGWLVAWKKPVAQVPAHCSSEQVTAGRDTLKEPKTLGKSEACTSSVQAVTSEVGINPAKNQFAIPHKLPSFQRAASTPVSSKASKFRKTNYTWVANPSKWPCAVKRWTSPRASESTRKLFVGAERTAKPLPKGDLGAKQKKSGVHLKLDASPNKYKWKASSLQPPSSTSKSVFKWQSEGRKEAGVSQVSRANFGLQTLSNASIGHGGLKSSFNDAALSTYKVKSRTKIIRRKGSCCSPTDKKSNSFTTMPLKSHYSLRKRNSLRGRPAPLKRTLPKELVQITKHRLCRLPASRMHIPAKEGSSLHLVRSPGANKVVQTRYRIVKKNVASSASSSSFSIPVPSWKTRRLVTSRSLVLNQMRQSTLGGKSQQLQPSWRNKGFCCIGGVMYRVSANKLSKTSSSPVRGGDLSHKLHSRTARLDCTASGLGYSPPSSLHRSATSRYIASRAVQRSLAIIRQAKQKKVKKEYCMYYNRFGKCNRGESCPYIHDPEKVAVCTRFLRGTCKKTDGTCSFSHKVSKDKCKKKHTLVCPDFSKTGICPKGAQCKLQHPQRKHHPRQPSTAGDSSQSRSSPKWRRLGEEAVRRDAAHLQDDGEIPGPSSAEQGVKFRSDTDTPACSRLQKLPSFISLQSPTSPRGVTHTADRDKTGEDTGKPLQIKPRL